MTLVDLDPSMRTPVPSEAQSLPLPRVIFGNDPSSSQAMNMGLHSGVTLTQEDVDLYVQLRVRPANGEPLKSDQRLMAEDVLTGERRVLFESAYPNIFPPRES